MEKNRILKKILGYFCKQKDVDKLKEDKALEPINGQGKHSSS